MSKKPIVYQKRPANIRWQKRPGCQVPRWFITQNLLLKIRYALVIHTTRPLDTTVYTVSYISIYRIIYHISCTPYSDSYRFHIYTHIICYTIVQYSYIHVQYSYIRSVRAKERLWETWHLQGDILSWLKRSCTYETWLYRVHERHDSILYIRDMTRSCTQETWLYRVHERHHWSHK